MKFVLVDRPSYWWPVTVRMPDPEKAGSILVQTLKVLFEPLPRQEALDDQEVYSLLSTEQDRAEHEQKQLLKIVKNWDDVVGADKNAVAFSTDVFASAIQQRWFRDAVYRAYTESLNGEKAQAGN